MPSLCCSWSWRLSSCKTYVNTFICSQKLYYQAPPGMHLRWKDLASQIQLHLSPAVLMTVPLNSSRSELRYWGHPCVCTEARQCWMLHSISFYLIPVGQSFSLNLKLDWQPASPGRHLVFTHHRAGIAGIGRAIHSFIWECWVPNLDSHVCIGSTFIYLLICLCSLCFFSLSSTWALRHDYLLHNLSAW